MTLLPLLSDAELAETITRLSVRLERLDRDGSARALAESCYLAQALDEALAERDRRAARRETA